MGRRLAIDIGTRKVMGILFEASPSGVQVLASARREHQGRAMQDGQIHDVPAVAQVVKEVVEELSAKVGEKVTSAYAAAAGRSLITARGRAEAQPRSRITEESLRQLEWEAVAAAQAAAVTGGDMSQGPGYYCVGYTVTHSWLDGVPISNLVGHVGNHCELEVVATFLPRGVVDALDAVFDLAGLELAGLTLEPIAALDAVVPPTMRHLNLALVDVGAGTSDIAITRDGTVSGYAMTPHAGDAVTEFLASQLLLDFNVAEQAKRQIQQDGSAQFPDVFGQTQQLSLEEFTVITQPLVSDLAQRIGNAILEINGGPPQAVLVVGGGSQTPGLAPALARVLGLPENRVGMRSRDAIQGVSGGEDLQGPDAVTPLGIALLAARSGGLPLVRVQVDDRWVRLFQPGHLTVGEALRAAGVPRWAVVGRPGAGITVTVNGRVRVFPGERGKPGSILMNGQPVSLDTVCTDMAHITWEEATHGKPAQPVAADLVTDDDWLRVIINGEHQEVPPVILINGRPANLQTRLADRDQVTIQKCSTLADLQKVLEWPGQVEEEPVRLTYNGAGHSFKLSGQVLVNGLPASPDAPLYNGCSVEIRSGGTTVRAAMASLGLNLPAAVPVKVNGNDVLLEPPVRCIKGGKEIRLDDELAPGDHVEVVFDEEWRPLLTEVLNYVDGILDRPAGNLVLMVDNQPASFTTPLYPGAVVTVGWTGVSGL